MADFISGVENDLSKGFQKLESMGSSLLEDTESVLSHPVESLERAGSATYGALRRGASYLGETAEQVGASTYGAVERGASYLEDTAENVYGKLMGEVSNLDKVVTSHLPPHHTKRTGVVPRVYTQVVPVVTTDSRQMLKKLVNWVILLLVLVLIGVIVYLTCKRYSLVGASLYSGDRTMAAALLTPELSAGLSTLAATL